MTQQKAINRIPLTVVRLESQPMACSGYLLGAINIGNQNLHVEAIRLAWKPKTAHDWEEDMQIYWHQTEEGVAELEKLEKSGTDFKSYYCTCGERMSDLEELSGLGQFTTQTIPGQDGEWTLYATPYLS
jgi:hypothetical protein